MKILKHYLTWLLLTPIVIAGIGVIVGVFVFAICGWALPLTGYLPWWGWLIWWACAAAVVSVVCYDFNDYDEDGTYIG